MPPTPPPSAPGAFSPGVERAIRVALEAHAGQSRKAAPTVPYAVHPVHVALLLAASGADEEVVQAGLLHDVVEDCPDWDAGRLAAEFGPRVAGIVAELTEDKSLRWEERKRGAIEAVPGLSPAALWIKAIDKLHNLESLCACLEGAADPEAIWEHFTGGRERTLAMARGLVEALGGRVPPLSPGLARALREVVGRLEHLGDPAPRPGAPSGTR